MKILIVEDTEEILQSVNDYLSAEGYVCETAATFDEAKEKINLYKYDCIILDISLPGGSGLDIIRILKENKTQAGIIIISAKNSLEDKISGLELGSDDYLTKPFHLSELNARVKAIIRRKVFDGGSEILFNEIRIDLLSRQVFVLKQEVILTNKEFELLLFFLSNKNKVVTKNSIAEHLWGDEMDQSDAFDFIYTHIKNLRKKLIEKGCPDYITTIYGMGYKWKTN